ncbi:MAG: DNA repair protein [Pseudobutyrivibrio sp.]|nr:DNA repair protein [Pseudobutyrivibrio sp.]
MKERYYLAIDLKSFYASVECVDRGLDVMTAKLVVADPERKQGTICLAISPAMKALGIKNRCRVFEIPKGIDYIMAPPRMNRYIQVSALIYEIYLSFVDKADVHVYSIDEAFLDVTTYLSLYNQTPKELAQTILGAIYQRTKLRATCGIGTNMYLAKIALDIMAKHAPDFMAELDEESYKKHLWKHRPLTDFWRIGSGTARHLQSLGLLTQEDIAKAPPKLLLKEFGAQSEYLIDHAWGREPCTISEIKNYRQKSHSLSSGQVLMRDYTFDEGLIILKEMANQLALDMVNAQVVSNNISLYVGYSFDTMPATGGSLTLPVTTNSIRIITAGFVELYNHHVQRDGLIRRLNLSANSIVDDNFEQYSFFVDPQIMEKDRHISQSVNALKEKYGKNAVLKGMDLQDAATTIERNNQVGGHKA